MSVFIAIVAVAIVLVIVGETGLLPNGELAEEKQTEFVVLSIMELLTICLIPLALRLFKFQRVKRELITPQGLRRWAMVRLMMIGDLILVNILLYYLFMNPAFGYMGIILFLCMFFIVPTMSRCSNELRASAPEENKK
ncbi:MAG: hypothetical protein IJM81_05170 [Prevotella sp.]|nr:hypothetical protein [Prevotella sp.]